jgi:hypothetical protein
MILPIDEDYYLREAKGLLNVIFLTPAAGAVAADARSLSFTASMFAKAAS